MFTGLSAFPLTPMNEQGIHERGIHPAPLYGWGAARQPLPPR